MAGRKSDFTLTKLDDLFSTQEQRDEEKLSKIRDIPLTEIDDFPDHPFKVRDDEDMAQLIESIKERGVITPARENNLNVVLRTTDVIGLPVDAYIPYFNLVVDSFEHSRKIKAVKKSLCNQNGITYCEINSKDPFAMAAQIKAIFRKNHVYVTSENENDIRFCRNLFFSVKRKNARTS